MISISILLNSIPQEISWAKFFDQFDRRLHIFYIWIKIDQWECILFRNCLEAKSYKFKIRLSHYCYRNSYLHSNDIITGFKVDLAKWY